MQSVGWFGPELFGTEDLGLWLKILERCVGGHAEPGAAGGLPSARRRRPSDIAGQGANNHRTYSSLRPCTAEPPGGCSGEAGKAGRASRSPAPAHDRRPRPPTDQSSSAWSHRRLSVHRLARRQTAGTEPSGPIGAPPSGGPLIVAAASAGKLPDDRAPHLRATMAVRTRLTLRMTQKCSYLAIIPAYNESSTVADVIRALREQAPDFDVLVVDDGSTDATAERARRRAPVLRMPFNLGIGGAMQAATSTRSSTATTVAVQVDGDGQHDPRHIRAACSTALSKGRRREHGHRIALPRPGRRLPLSAQPPGASASSRAWSR